LTSRRRYLDLEMAVAPRAGRFAGRDRARWRHDDVRVLVDAGRRGDRPRPVGATARVPTVTPLPARRSAPAIRIPVDGYDRPSRLGLNRPAHGRRPSPTSVPPAPTPAARRIRVSVRSARGASRSSCPSRAAARARAAAAGGRAAAVDREAPRRGRARPAQRRRARLHGAVLGRDLHLVPEPRRTRPRNRKGELLHVPPTPPPRPRRLGALVPAHRTRRGSPHAWDGAAGKAGSAGPTAS